jgi:hypothetical protein
MRLVEVVIADNGIAGIIGGGAITANIYAGLKAAISNLSIERS